MTSNEVRLYPDGTIAYLPDGTRVVNVKVEQHDVYIGRGTKWGNPFSHKKGTRAKEVVGSVEEAIRRYRAHIAKRPDLLDALQELRGKRLGCSCKPGPCHGDVLLELMGDKFYGSTGN